MPPVPYDSAALTSGAFLSGATMMGYLVAALYFLRFWKRSHDRLFLLFAVAFLLMGAQRVAMLAWSEPDERGQVMLYGLRLVAFLVILAAIVDKNRAANPTHKGGELPRFSPSPTKANRHLGQ